jgi:hypothetical protein
MATFSSQNVGESGLTATYNAANAGGDEFVNDGMIILHIKNTDGSEHTVTVTAQNTSETVPGYGSMTKSNASVAVPATTGERFLGPFPIRGFNDTNGKCQITYTSATGMTVAVLRVNTNNTK